MKRGLKGIVVKYLDLDLMVTTYSPMKRGLKVTFRWASASLG